jgi:hypothetical protein
VRLASLPIIGLTTAAAYAANAIHYGWAPFNRNWMDDLAAWGIALALIILYWAGYTVLLQSGRLIPLRGVIIPAAVLVAISFVTIPYDSTDVFLYMGMGWSQAHYGLNPYTNVLRDIPGASGDPMIDSDWMRTNKNPWLDLPLVYGFTFASLIKGVAWLGRGNWWFTLALFKLLNAAAYTGIGAILFSLARTLGQLRPDVALYLFAWSPLILLHHIANAHNDLLMGFLIMLAMYLSIGRGAIWAPAVLVTATLLKYITLPLIPIALLFILRKEGWRRAAFSAVAALVVGLVWSLPYLGSIGRFRFDLILVQLSKTTAGSLYALIFYAYRITSLGSIETFGKIVKVLMWASGLGLMIREGHRFWRKKEPSIEDLISLSSWILFIVIFVASSQFYSWYIGMFLPLALLLDTQHWLRQLAVLLGGTHVLSLTSLSRKGIGYFVLTTGLAVGLLTKHRRVHSS